MLNNLYNTLRSPVKMRYFYHNLINLYIRPMYTNEKINATEVMLGVIKKSLGRGSVVLSLL